jgi:putative ABC transport system permease protein
MVVAAAIALISTLLFALTPALTASRVDLTGALKDRGFLNADPRGSRGRRLLVALQVLLSFILLVAAGLFARTILHFESMDAGFDRSVLLLKSDFLAVGIDKAKGLDFYRRSLDRIRELPGVRAASWAEDLPFERTLALLERIRPEEQESDRWLRVEGNAVSSGYFKTVGMAILQGRDFTTREMDSSANVVIVNETLVRRFWPGTTPVGKYLRVRGQDDARFEIVGVVKDAKYRTPWEGEKPYAYFPFWRFLYYHLDLHVSGYGDPLQLVDSIRKACQDVDPGVNLDNPRLMSAQLDSLLLQERSAAFLFMTFGGLALIMAAVGLYGIVSYSVARRTHEFGIRMVLGARSVDIFKHVVSEGIALVLTGMAIGLPCCIVLARLLSSRLHGLSPFDPITYCGISLLCVSVAAIAVVLPARKAAKDPARALRCE